MVKTKGIMDVSVAIIAPTIAALFIIHSTFAQDAPVLEKFTADELNGKVKLSWTIAAGGTCNGIQIQRSTDSVSFIEIGSLEGVCGNLSFSTDYSFTDDDPEKNKTNVYRLDLGGNGFSEQLAVLVIDTDATGYALFPLPLVEESILYFRNDGMQKATLRIYDTAGNLLRSIEEETDRFVVTRASFPSSGTYLFRIEVEGTSTVVTGKLPVQ